jgi:IclR family KDG regulon transcriptional repressor
MKDRNAYEVPAISRALDILEFLNQNEEASFTEIHVRLGLPKSSTYGIVSTLETRGYIRRIGQDGKYMLGLKLYELGTLAVARLDLRKECQDILRGLARKTDQTCHLGVLDDIEGVYLEKVESSRPVVLNSWLGKRLSLHCTAIGKALLAWQGEARLDSILSRLVLQKHTDRTITEVEQLKNHLLLVKKNGYSLDDEENEPDIRCVAVPVWNITGEVVAAISLSGLTNQLSDERIPELVRDLREAAGVLSARLGRSVKKG